jgi:hypothetical protein
MAKNRDTRKLPKPNSGKNTAHKRAKTRSSTPGYSVVSYQEHVADPADFRPYAVTLQMTDERSLVELLNAISLHKILENGSEHDRCNLFFNTGNNTIIVSFDTEASKKKFLKECAPFIENNSITIS